MNEAVERTFEDLREDALRELDRFALATWDTYGVKDIHLKEEMQSWYWKVVRITVGRKEKYVDELCWRGIGTSLESHIEKRRVAILNSTTPIELTVTAAKARDTISNAALYLWSREKVSGPSSSLRLVRDADRADALARYLESQGKDLNAESQRRRAKLLRRKAAGEDIDIPRRASGAIDRVRALFADLEKDGLHHARAEYIQAGVGIGVHPGTCAVQYAKWKREKPNAMQSPQSKDGKAMLQKTKPPWEV